MDCPYCHKTVTIETAFGRWLRANGLLDSRAGFTASDHDIRWHKFKTELGREFQLMMNIETKSNGADLNEPQRDSMYIENQLLRNRRQTPTKRLQWQVGTPPLRVYSPMVGHRIWVRHFGVHLLRFSGQGPEDSEWIIWNRSRIDVPTLTRLLTFDLDPDTLRLMDYRSHHKITPVLTLPGLERP